MLENYVWSPESKDIIYPLWAQVLRSESRYQFAMGTKNYRRIVTSAKANLYPLKLCKVVLQQNAHTHMVNPYGKKVLRHLNPALALMYQYMGVKTFQKHKNKVSIEQSMNHMFLGASAGINRAAEKEIKQEGKPTVKVSASGKKFEVHEHDLTTLLRLVREGGDIPVYWTITPKDEVFFTFDKQYNDEKYAQWKDKCRVFVIPSSNFIILERFVSKLRMMRERGRVIQIGFSFGRGGMDYLAECLGIFLENCFDPIICGGDVNKFDMNVKQFFLNLYYSSMLVHEDPSTEDYEIKAEIIKALIKAIINRITHYFGEIWGIQRGGVPSGCYNTSHMDSWIMALYFCLFAIWQVMSAPKEHRVQLHKELIKVVRIIVYGDDHNWNKGKGLGATYFSAVAFADFLKKSFDVELRDIEDGVPFCSTVANGWLVTRGTTFLKHQVILNPDITPGQCKFLPFRETREFICRAVWGRTPKKRDTLDVMLSVLGHAYGTHGANYDAWKSLKFFYEELLRTMPQNEEQAIAAIMDRQDRMDLRKMRQHSISKEDLLTGFPTFMELTKKNVLDKAYHQQKEIDDDEEMVLMDDCGF